MNIVIALPLTQRQLDKVSAAAPDTKVTLLNLPQRYLFRGGRGLPVAFQESPAITISESQAIEEERSLDEALRDAEVLFTPTATPQDITRRAPNLRWVQTGGAGTEGLRGHPILETDVIITTGSGIHGIPMAEFVLTYMLNFAKNVAQLAQNKRDHRWQAHMSQELYGKTLGVVGLGAIGKEVARLARAFGMRVIATRRSAIDNEAPMFADEVLPASKLPYLLGESDYVVLSLAATEETRGYISDAELRLMKPTAMLINISRGYVVDTDALVQALKDGWIAGAALDVASPEPLPAEHGLWDMPNVFISPHMSSATDLYMERLTDLFCENLRRYISGEPMLNVYERSLGY
jgi:phosphoglycerate dehydrogenase-like enzyme